MVTRLQDAKIAVTLDTQEARDRIEKLQQEVENVERQRREMDQKKRDKQDEDKKEARREIEDSQRARGSRFAINLQRPFTEGLISAAGAIPQILPGLDPAAAANATRAALSLGEFGPSLLKGIVKGVAPEDLKDALSPALDAAFAGIGGVSELISKFKSFEESILPAVQDTVRIARATGLTATPLNLSELKDAFEENVDYTKLQLELSRRGRKQALENVGEALGKTTTQTLSR